METQEVLSKIDNGTIPPGVQVFPYQLLFGGGTFVLTVFGILFFIGAFFATLTLSISTTEIVVLLFTGVCGGYCIYTVWKQFPELKNHEKTMVVITNEGVIRRLGLHVDEFPFDVYPNVRTITQYGSIEVHMGNEQEEKKLISNWHFGSGMPIFQAIYERQRVFNPNAKISSQQTELGQLQ